MDFLVDFAVTVPTGTPADVVDERNRAEASAAADLARDGHLIRLWREPGASVETRAVGLNGADLPRPQLTRLYRLKASVGDPLELGVTAQGQRRIVPLTCGSFDSVRLGSGTLVPGVSADWQTILADGTALGDIRYTLCTEEGHLLDVRSRSVRHGSADVLARLAKGEPVDPHEYTFRAATQIETGEPSLQWVNQGVFVSVGARDPGGVTYDTYLVA
jgi:hypothetical protein